MRNLATGCVAAFAAAIVAFSTPSATAAPSTAKQPTAETAAKKNTTARGSNARHVRSVRRSSRHAQRSGKSRKATVADKRADKSSTKNTAAVSEPAENQQKNQQKTLPPAVANANAEMLDGEAIADAKPVEQPAAQATDANTTVATPDQINDLDRAAMSTPRLQTINAGFQMRDETDITQTSLIGRIFIAMGALLTIGSAVRLVMG